MDKFVKGLMLKTSGTAEPSQKQKQKEKKWQLHSRDPNDPGKKKLYQPVRSKFTFTFSLRPFSSIREMRSLPPPSSRGKMHVMGIGPFLTDKLKQQMEMILQTERDRLERTGKARGRKGVVTEDEPGVGVFGEEEDNVSKTSEEHSDDEEKSEDSNAKSAATPPAEERVVEEPEHLEYGERDILQRAKVYNNRDSVKHYKQFWKTWKGNHHAEKFDTRSIQEEVKKDQKPQTRGGDPTAIDLEEQVAADLRGSKKPVPARLEFETAPVPKKLTSLIPNCNNIYRPRGGIGTKK